MPEMLESSYMAPLIRCEIPVMPLMRCAQWLVQLMRCVYRGMQKIRFGGAEESM
jgi:hypothetical protein